MERNLFQQAKDALTNLTNMHGNASESEQKAADEALQAAYKEASPEEKQQLQELEQKLQQKNHIS